MSEFPNSNIDKYIGKIVNCSIDNVWIPEPVLINFHGSNLSHARCYITLTTLHSVSPFIDNCHDLRIDNSRSSTINSPSFKYRFGDEKNFYYYIIASGNNMIIESDSYCIIHKVLGDGIDVHNDINHDWVKLPAIKYREKEFLVIY